MANRELRGEELRSVIEQERSEVLETLAKLSKADDAAREKEMARRARFQRDVAITLLRGKGIVPVVQMAEALGWTRQMAHRAIREAEQSEGGVGDA